MNEKLFFTDDELMLTSTLLANLKQLVGPSLRADDEEKIRRHLAQAMESNQIKRDVFGLNPVVCALQTAQTWQPSLAGLCAYRNSTRSRLSSRVRTSATCCCRLPKT